MAGSRPQECRDLDKVTALGTVARVDAADRTLLDADAWFGALPPARRELLIGHARPRAIESGRLIYALGDPPNGLWAVLEGQVRLKGYPAAGLEFLALTLRPGTWFGEVSTLDGGPRPHDAVAFGSARLLHLPMAVFHQLAEETPALYLDLGRLVCRHQRVALDFIAQTVGLPLDVRLAKLLASRMHDVEGVLNVRQEDLAVMLSVSRQTLNARLRRLAQAGVIKLAYARIEVCDVARLRELAATDDGLDGARPLLRLGRPGGRA